MASKVIVSELTNIFRFAIDKASKASTEAELKKMQEDAKEGNTQSIKPEVNKAASNEALNEIQALKSKISKILSFIGISFSLTKMNQIVEAYGELHDKIKNASGELENQAEIQNKILEAANASRQSYESFGNYVATLAQQNKDLFPIDEATAFAKLLSQNEIGTGNTSNLANVQNILNGVISSGKMSSNVFSQLKKSAPEVLTVLEEGLNKNEKQLESMAAAGMLTAGKIKEAYTSASDTITEKFNNTSLSVSDALTIVSNRFGKKITEVNDKFKLTEKVANLIVKAYNGVEKVIDTISTAMEKLSDACGGVENMLKLVALAVGAIFIAWKGPKLIADIRKGLSILNPATLKIAAIAAAILAVFLVVEDFVSFLQGKKSVFGDLLEGAGIGADKAREKILTFFENVKSTAQKVIKSVGDWWEKHKETVKAVFEGIWSVIQFVFNNIVDFVRTVISKCKEWWDKYGDGVKTVFNAIKNVVSTALNWIKDRVSDVVSAITEWWNTYGDDVLSMLDSLKSGFDDICNLIIDVFGGAIQFVADLINGDFAGAFDTWKETVSNVLNDINDFFKDIFGIDILGAITDFIASAQDALSGFFSWITEHFPALSGLVGDVSSAIDIDTKKGVSNSTLGNAISAGETNNTNNNSVVQNNYNTFNVTDRNAATEASSAIKSSGRSAIDEMTNQLAHTGR